MNPPRFFVTATDTGVGKTEVSCALLTLMREAGWAPAAFKPYESGVTARGGPADASRLWEATGRADPLDQVVLQTFREPVAPGVAAVREGRVVKFADTLRGFHRFDGRALVVEGAGGLFVPLNAKKDVIDLIAATELPAILVARAGLGTLNHTLLSIDALAARKLSLTAVVLVKANPAKDVSERDNADWIARRRPGVKVLGPVPFVADEARRAKAVQRVVAPLVPRKR